jgi:hypothetical protein
MWRDVSPFNTAPCFWTFLILSCSIIARKSNFCKHLKVHGVYRKDMELDDFWVFSDLSRTKDTARAKRSSKIPARANIEILPEMHLALQTHEECHQPIALPQLNTIGALTLNRLFDLFKCN